MASDSVITKPANGWSSKFSLKNAKKSHQCKWTKQYCTYNIPLTSVHLKVAYIVQVMCRFCTNTMTKTFALKDVRHSSCTFIIFSITFWLFSLLNIQCRSLLTNLRSVIWHWHSYARSKALEAGNVFLDKDEIHQTILLNLYIFYFK